MAVYCVLWGEMSCSLYADVREPVPAGRKEEINQYEIVHGAVKTYCSLCCERDLGCSTGMDSSLLRGPRGGFVRGQRGPHQLAIRALQSQSVGFHTGAMKPGGGFRSSSERSVLTWPFGGRV